MCKKIFLIEAQKNGTYRNEYCFRDEPQDNWQEFLDDDTIHHFIVYPISIADGVEITRELQQEIVNAPITVEDSRFAYLTDEMLNSNYLGFDPNIHVFVCHKCGGRLSGKDIGKDCCCMSGWVRPYQKYIDASTLTK